MSAQTTTKSTKTEQSLFEEDDEFEEFPTEGILLLLVIPISAHWVNHVPLEWEVLGEESGEKQLWEENWDDDDVEDDFSRQLR